MTWAQFLLFVHVAVAVIWVGGGLMMQFFGIRASMSGEPARMAALGEDIEWIANRVFIPSSLIAFVSGILLVYELPFYTWKNDWIVLGLLLYATTFLAGILFLGPESGRIGKLKEEQLSGGRPAHAPPDHARAARSGAALRDHLRDGREARVRRLGAAPGPARRRACRRAHLLAVQGRALAAAARGRGPEPVGDVPAEPS